MRNFICGKKEEKKQSNKITKRVERQAPIQADESNGFVRLERAPWEKETTKEIFAREPFRIVTIFRAMLLCVIIVYFGLMIAATVTGIVVGGIKFAASGVSFFAIVTLLMLLEILYPGNKNVAAIVIIFGSMLIALLPILAVFYYLSQIYGDPPATIIILATIGIWLIFFRISYKWSEERRFKGHTIKELEEKINNRVWNRRK